MTEPLIWLLILAAIVFLPLGLYVLLARAGGHDSAGALVGVVYLWFWGGALYLAALLVRAALWVLA